MSEAAPRAPGAGAFRFLVITVALDMIAGSIVVPITPKLVQDLAGGDAASGARWIGFFVAAWAAMQFVFSPIIGGLSDRFGRRPVILLSMLGLALDSVLMAVAPTLAWILVARLISGALSATMASANAYIADVTEPDKRAARFGLLGAAWGVGFVLGPAIGGVLGELGPRAPFWGSAIMAAANLAYGFFVLPESLPKDRRAKFSVKHANPFSAITFFAQTPAFAALGVVMFLTALSGQVLQGTWIPYVNYRYHWPTWVMGASLAAVGASYIFVQAFVVGRFVARFGELAAVFVSLLGVALAYVLYGASPWTWLFFAAIPIFALSGVGVPGMQALMSRMVPATQQGRLQGARAGLSAIAAVLGPMIFTETFARAVSAWKSWAPPGLAFYLSAAMLVAAFAVAFAATRGPAWRPAIQPSTIAPEGEGT
jgi:DHA1 family tetracycline resistance protein-like MFS transporter